MPFDRASVYSLVEDSFYKGKWGYQEAVLLFIVEGHVLGYSMDRFKELRDEVLEPIPYKGRLITTKDGEVFLAAVKKKYSTARYKTVLYPEDDA